MVIMYRISPISYILGRALINVDHIGLVNIIAGERVVPELIQQEASPQNIAGIVGNLLKSPLELCRIRENLAMVREKLGHAGASARTADIALSLMAGENQSKATSSDKK
jgi:lipid-A-disaccharide synthase